MGVNIYVYRLSDGKFKKEEGVFDSFRHTYDREFFEMIVHSNPTIVHTEDPLMPDFYFRPNNFDDAREWVGNTLPYRLRGNKERLFGLLDTIESDEDLYIYFST